MLWCVTTVSGMLQPAKSPYGQPTRSVTQPALKDNSSEVNIIQQKNPSSRFPAYKFTTSSIFTAFRFTTSISDIIQINSIHFWHHLDLHVGEREASSRLNEPIRS